MRHFQAQDAQHGNNGYGSTWSLKKIIALDDTGEMDIKLWASWADDSFFQVNKRYIFRNMEVDRWKGHLSVSSTDETICEVKHRCLINVSFMYTVNHRKTWHFILDYNYDISCTICTLFAANETGINTLPVSYTHLTLPTIYSV